MSKHIGIIGCGWLGLPLAISLIHQGHQVHGSTTSEEKIKSLKNEGIIPFLISLTETEIVGDISNFIAQVDILVINVPPKLRGGHHGNYVKKMQLLYQEIKKSPLQKIIFVSSTSVYGDCTGEVNEATIPQPTTNSGKQLLEVENIFKNDTNLQATVIRFGGLIGPNRHPITMLSGRRDLPNGNHPINLIHLNDCIRIIAAVIQNTWWNEILNGVYPEYQSKRKYYNKKAIERGLQIPDYKEDNSTKGKKVLSKSLINVKKFQFTTTL